MKTKQTIEDLRVSKPELDDYELLADQNMIQMLKDTLKESEQYRQVQKSRSNSLAHADEGIAEVHDNEEEGRYPDEEGNEGEDGIPDDERDDWVAWKDRQDAMPFKTFQNESLDRGEPVQESDSEDGSKIRIRERRDPQPGKPVDARMRAEERRPESEQKKNDQNVFERKEAEPEEVRDTADFKTVPDLRADDVNPFKDNLLKKELLENGSNVSEKPESSKQGSIAKARKLGKGLEGGLEKQDLERIERIFKNYKFDDKILDLEDSDIEYF
jgi:hypothetical protein